MVYVQNFKAMPLESILVCLLDLSLEFHWLLGHCLSSLPVNYMNCLSQWIHVTMLSSGSIFRLTSLSLSLSLSLSHRHARACTLSSWEQATNSYSYLLPGMALNELYTTNKKKNKLQCTETSIYLQKAIYCISTVFNEYWFIPNTLIHNHILGCKLQFWNMALFNNLSIISSSWIFAQMLFIMQFLYLYA